MLGCYGSAGKTLVRGRGGCGGGFAVEEVERREVGVGCAEEGGCGGGDGRGGGGRGGEREGGLEVVFDEGAGGVGGEKGGLNGGGGSGGTCRL